MSIDLNDETEEPINSEQYIAEIARRLPLRSAHKLHLPGMLMHQTKKRTDLLMPDEFCEKIWGAGMWLASYIFKHPEEFKGKRVLDMGTGSGVVAIAAALAGGNVTAFDKSVKSILLATANAKVNGVSIKAIEQCVTDQTQLPDFDILTATDIMYSRSLSRACIQTFKNTSESISASRTFYICDQSGWTEASFHAFRKDIKATGARFEIIKGGKKFCHFQERINNNSVTAVKIEASL